MRKTVSKIVVLMALSSPALAESTRIDLDTDPGHFSIWEVSDLSATSVDFKATFLATKKNRNWAPTYSVELIDDQGKSINFKGTYVGPLLASTAVISDGSQQISATSILEFNLKEQYAVSIAWSNGVVRVRSNGVERDYPVGFSPTKLKISCSTGELEVKDIVFNNATPAESVTKP
jgi:hypothetical protein